MKIPTKTIAYTALMTALVLVSTAFLGVNMGTTYTNLGDTMIFVTAALFGPLPALIAGGLGSFFADMIVFPLTMWYTLVIKGLEGLICGLVIALFKKLRQNSRFAPLWTFFAMLAAGLFMIAGYFVAESALYGTRAAAVFALSANAVQAALSIALAMILVHGFKLMTLAIQLKMFDKKNKRNTDDRNAGAPADRNAGAPDGEKTENKILKKSQN
jgi:uncharacterized membrane protein